MDSKLANAAKLAQKDKGPAFISLIPEILSNPNPTQLAGDLHQLVDTLVNQESVGLVVGRQVLSELVKLFGEQNSQITNSDLRKRVIEDTLSIVQPRIVSYEEQVCRLSLSLIRPFGVLIRLFIFLPLPAAGQCIEIPIGGYIGGRGGMV